MRILYASILAAILFVHVAVADEPAESHPAPPLPRVLSKEVKAADFPPRETVVYRIKNVAAVDLAKALSRQLQTTLDRKFKHDGFVVDSPVVIIPEVAVNSLIVCANPSHQQKISDLIGTLDANPTLIMIEILVQETVDGKTTTLSRPQVITIDGTEAFIEIGGEKKTLTIKLTPHVVKRNDADESR